MKMMKRWVPIFLSLLLIAAASGCGSSNSGTEETGGNEISQLFSEGYQCTMSTADESVWRGVFQKEDSWETVYKAEAPLTAELYEAFNAAFEAEDSEQATQDFLGTLKEVTVTEITDQIPTQEELDSYIGRTLGDLESEGFENSGYLGDEGEGYSFFYDGPLYSCIVSLEEGTVIEDMDDYSANDLRALKIGGMEFTGFSFQLLEEQ